MMSAREANGLIIYSQPTGVWEVHGPILTEYAQIGYEQSVVGYPIRDVGSWPEGPTFDGTWKPGDFEEVK